MKKTRLKKIILYTQYSNFCTIKVIIDIFQAEKFGQIRTEKDKKGQLEAESKGQGA
jgi:hypothetical protein